MVQLATALNNGTLTEIVVSRDPHLVANLVERPEGMVYQLLEGETARYFRLQVGDEGWPSIIEVTGLIKQPLDRLVETISKTHRAVQQRKRIIKLETQDHFERTRIAELIKPTAATKKHLKPDPIQVLLSRGAIDNEEAMAAREIYRILTRMMSGIFSKAVSLDTRGGGGDSMSERLALAYTLRYKPWADHFSANHHRGGPPILEVVVDVVIDGQSCQEVDGRHHWRKGKAADYVAEGLAKYVEISGGHVPHIRGEDDDLA